MHLSIHALLGLWLLSGGGITALAAPDTVPAAAPVTAPVSTPAAVAAVSNPTAAPTATGTAITPAPAVPEGGRVFGRTARPAAAAADLPPAPTAPATTSWGWRYMVSMLLVGALLYGVLRTLKWLRFRLTGQTSSILRVQERLALDTKHSIVLISAGDTKLLLACSGGNVQVLERWPATSGTGLPQATGELARRPGPAVADAGGSR